MYMYVRLCGYVRVCRCLHVYIYMYVYVCAPSACMHMYICVCMFYISIPRVLYHPRVTSAAFASFGQLMYVFFTGSLIVSALFP